MSALPDDLTEMPTAELIALSDRVREDTDSGRADLLRLMREFTRRRHEAGDSIHTISRHMIHRRIARSRG